MTDEEELRELLSSIPMSGRRFLRRYFRASGEEQASMRGELSAAGMQGWADLLEGTATDREGRAAFVATLDELERTSPTNIREVRIVADYRGQLLRVAKIFWSLEDLSIYMLPYAAHGRYFFGRQSFAEHEMEQTFDFRQQLSSETKAPYLSIHESGQVHIKGRGQDIAGPIGTTPLPEWRGQHLASISVDRFDGLPPFEGTPKMTSTAMDHVIHVDEGVSSGRLALYANGYDDAFDFRRGLVATLTRAGRPRPLRVQVAPISQLPMGEAGPGVIAIGGWRPDTPPTAPNDFLCIRGE